MNLPAVIRPLLRRASTALTVIGMLVSVTGCEQPAGELFPALERPMAWPEGEPRPRIQLVGALSGSGDLHASRTGGEVLHAAFHGPRPDICFSAPHGVARNDGSLVAVADGSAGAVHILDLQRRTHLVTFGAESQRFGVPLGVAFAGQRLFATDAELGQVVELDLQGRVVNRVGQDDLVRPVGIVFVPSRELLYVVDGGAHTVYGYDLGGRLQATIGGRGSAPGQFNYPTHIAHDGRDRLAIADSANFRIQLLDLDGRALASIGKKGDGAGDVALPKGVAFDSAGHLYVVDAHFENFQIFDPSGRLLLAVGEEGADLGRFSLPAGLAIDHGDRLWVADSANRRIQVFQYIDYIDRSAPEAHTAPPTEEH